MAMPRPYLLTLRSPLAPAVVSALADFEPAVPIEPPTVGSPAGRFVYRVSIEDQADLYGLLTILQRFGVDLESVAAEDLPE